jgi:anti-sigma B factor antagonist
VNDETTPSPIPFQVAEEDRDGVRIVAIDGELDLSTAPRLEEMLEGDGEAGLLIDLSGCEFIDSTGIGLIVRTWQRLDADRDEGARSRFALCGLSAQVRRLLQITGLESSIETYRDRDEALRGLNGA